MNATLERFLTARPKTAVLSLAVLHFLGLSFAVLLTQSTLNLDVLEQVAWSRDPQWVYSKHPPLPAWIMAAAMWVSGNRPWAAALLGPLASAAALPIVWVYASRMTDPARALIAVFLLEGVIYFNFSSVEFNHNVVLLPLWAFIAYAAHRAYVEGKPADWVLLGFAAALGILGKYATALLLAGVALAFVVGLKGRIRSLGWGPALAVLCGSIVLAPHLWSLYQIDFAPFKYASERLESATSIFDHIRFPVEWLAVQTLDVATALLLSFAFLFPPRRLKDTEQPPQQRQPIDAKLKRDLQFTIVLFATPLLICAAIQAVGGVRFQDMWGFPMFVLIGVPAALFTVMRPPPRNALPKLAIGSLAALTLAVIAVGAFSFEPYITKRGQKSYIPLRNLPMRPEQSGRLSMGASLFGMSFLTPGWGVCFRPIIQTIRPC